MPEQEKSPADDSRDHLDTSTHTSDKDDPRYMQTVDSHSAETLAMDAFQSVANDLITIGVHVKQNKLGNYFDAYQRNYSSFAEKGFNMRRGFLVYLVAQGIINQHQWAVLDRDEAAELLFGGQYTIDPDPETLIGRGGMGRVYSARHTRSRKHVALKVRMGEPLDSRGRLHFIKGAVLSSALEELEARAKGASKHFVSIHDIDTDMTTGTPRDYYAMPILQGSTLQSHLGELSEIQMADILLQISQGLKLAHRIGVIHRDIKPDNLFLQKNSEVVFMDWDIAFVQDKPCAAEVRERLTEAARDHNIADFLADGQSIAGTPVCMAPEIGGNEDPTGKADMFSLASTMYMLIEGKIPYPEAKSLMERRAAMTEGLPDISMGVPERLRAIYETIRDPDPKSRLSSAELEEMILELYQRELAQVQRQRSKTWEKVMLTLGVPAAVAVGALTVLAYLQSAKHEDGSIDSSQRASNITNNDAEGEGGNIESAEPEYTYYPNSTSRGPQTLPPKVGGGKRYTIVRVGDDELLYIQHDTSKAERGGLAAIHFMDGDEVLKRYRTDGSGVEPFNQAGYSGFRIFINRSLFRSQAGLKPAEGDDIRVTWSVTDMGSHLLWETDADDEVVFVGTNEALPSYVFPTYAAYENFVQQHN